MVQVMCGGGGGGGGGDSSLKINFKGFFNYFFKTCNRFYCSASFTTLVKGSRHLFGANISWNHHLGS